MLLEKQLRPLVQAELSVLVDVLHTPEALFPPGTKCEIGGFISRSVINITNHFDDLNTHFFEREKPHKLVIDIF